MYVGVTRLMVICVATFIRRGVVSCYRLELACRETSMVYRSVALAVYAVYFGGDLVYDGVDYYCDFVYVTRADVYQLVDIVFGRILHYNSVVWRYLRRLGNFFQVLI